MVSIRSLALWPVPIELADAFREKTSSFTCRAARPGQMRARKLKIHFN